MICGLMRLVFLSPFHCKLSWRDIARRRVRSLGVVVLFPVRDANASFLQSGEKCLVEALVPKAAVAALDEAVLHRLARSDVMPVDLPALRSAQDRHAGELGPVV